MTSWHPIRRAKWKTWKGASWWWHGYFLLLLKGLHLLHLPNWRFFVLRVTRWRRLMRQAGIWACCYCSCLRCCC